LEKISWKGGGGVIKSWWVVVASGGVVGTGVILIFFYHSASFRTTPSQSTILHHYPPTLHNYTFSPNNYPSLITLQYYPPSLHYCIVDVHQPQRKALYCRLVYKIVFAWEVMGTQRRVGEEPLGVVGTQQRVG
jgi:hypothetical protein